MKDILLKKAPSGATHTAPVVIPVSPVSSSKLAFYVEKYVATLSKLGEWAYQRIVKNPDFVVLKPAHYEQPQEYKIEKKSDHIRGSRRKKIAEKIREKGRATHRAVKSPVGKLAIVQALAIVALFTYVTPLRNARILTNGPQPSPISTNLVTQKYLPAIGEYTAPQAFTEVASKATTPQLPFHTWVTPWNLESAQANKGTYSSFSAFWATVTADGVHIEPKADWNNWQQFKKSTLTEGTKYYLTITGNPNFTNLALIDATTQQEHIAELLKVVQAQGFDGIDIDYEALGAENRSIFTNFVSNLSKVFHENHKEVAITLEARLGNAVPMDWHAISQVSDEVRVMIYDYHARNTSEPGPVSPIGWVKEVLDYAQTTVDTTKLVVGLGNYGYDWTKTVADDGTVTWQGVGLSFDQATALATAQNTPIIRITGIDNRGYDVGSTATFTYKDGSDHEHAVWFEDKESLQAKVNLVSQYRTKGIIFWSVGLGDATFWQTVHSRT